ncbi:MAG TPA: hypothetical protein VFG59_16900 [Anaeromyxobacter sp.]|nr:hypothetical protein [Anaeromyxobacter sp.]
MIRRLGPLLALALAGYSPFRVEEPNVRKGNERLQAGDSQGALDGYHLAEKAVGPRPEIDHDRGDALYRLGRTEEAQKAWGRAAERGAAALASRSRQNQGTALAAAGDRDGAVAALEEALHLDPTNEDARFDLEVLLRRRMAEQERAKDAGPAEHQPAATKDQGPPAGPDRREDRAQGGAEEQREALKPSPAGAGTHLPGDEEDAKGRAAGEAPISRREAERILDAFRSREQVMPPGAAERRTARRGDADHDW